MKKTLKKIISTLLVVVMLFTGATGVSATDGVAMDNSGVMFATNAINSLLNAVFIGVSALFPKNFPTVDEYYESGSENFYAGMDTFVDEPVSGAKWHLGFGQASMVPENLKDGSKEYYTGGYFTQKIDGVYDDQSANAIAMHDNSGRGTVVSVSIDGVGVNNADVRAIRAEAERKLSEQGVDSDIVAINISATHCHTVIDTQGFGLGPIITKLFHNILSFLPFMKPIRSIDADFYPVMIDATSDAIVEAYNTARTNTMFAVSTGESKIIAVTSSNPSEGKSTTCANFAISFANAGFKVLLVECDLRKPTVAKNFDIKPKNGLSSILGGFCSVNDAINADVLSNLDIITAGDIPPNPSELLGSRAMRTFLSASSEIYDYVFLDTPPVNVVTDSQLMNDIVAGIVFVVKEKYTTHPDIQSALDKIRLANGKVLGFVKTFGSVGKTGRYGKKYAYKDYKYGYSAENNK